MYLDKNLASLINEKELRYAKLENQNIEAKDLERAELESCIFLKCKICDGTNLNLADIIGCNFSENSLRNVKIERADFCSNVAKDTYFFKVSFYRSTLSDSIFINCIFEDCSFDNITLTNTKFINCKFKKLSCTHSSSYLNEFDKCTFISCEIRNNFYYNLLIHCHIDKYSFEKKALKFNAFLNTNEKDNSLLITTSDECESNYTNISKTIQDYNYRTINEEGFLWQVVNDIKEMVEKSVIIRSEQITFIEKFITCKNINHFISAMTIFEVLHVLHYIITLYKNNCNTFEKNITDLKSLKNVLLIAFKDKIDEIPDFDIYNEIQEKGRILIQIHYNERPQIELVSLLNSIANKLNIEAVPAKRITARQGSFIEIIDVALKYAPLMTTIISLTANIIIPFVKKKKSKSDNEHHDISISVKQQLLSSKKENFSLAVVAALDQNNVSINNNFQGYNQSNIIEIIVNESK